MTIIARRAHSSLFMYHPDTNTFTSEASILSHHHVNFLSQAYDDACDVGFLLVSAKTGVAALFTMIDEVRDADRDVKFWEFQPCADAIRRNPRLEGSKLFVYNT